MIATQMFYFQIVSTDQVPWMTCAFFDCVPSSDGIGFLKFRGEKHLT